jgi:hypothetical protein
LTLENYRKLSRNAHNMTTLSAVVPGSRPLVFCAALWLAVAAFLFFAVFAPMGNLPSDTEYSVETAKSLYFKHTLAIEKNDHFWAVNLTRNGTYHSRYGLGYAVSFLPQVALADLVSRAFGVRFDYALRFLLSFTNTIYAAIIALLFFLLFLRLGYGARESAVTVVLICCGSILLPYSKIIHAEAPSTACLVLLLVLIARNTRLDFSGGAALGAVAGALYLLKIGNAPLCLIVASYAAYCLFAKRATPEGALAFALTAGLPLAGLMALNHHCYGSAFNFGYGEEQRQFGTPLHIGLAGLLLSPSKSVFVFSPLLVIAAASLSPLFRSHRTVAVFVATIVLTDLLFYARWHDWSGGWGWGPRLVVPAMIVGHVPLIVFVHNLGARLTKRAVLAAVLLVAFWINLLGALVWYQEIYYFHKDYTTVSHSHIAIASQIFCHKLMGRPEVYNCADFCVDCTTPSYHRYWNNLAKGNTVDLNGFATYRGFATMWTGIAVNFGMKWVVAIPLLLLGAAVVCGRRALRLCGGT